MIGALILAAALSCSALHIDPTASVPLAPVATTHAPGSCHVRTSHGYQIPDPNCSPGAVNPTLTAQVLKNLSFRTGCVRDHVTSEAQKEAVYSWYGISKPAHNKGPAQMCELDHVIDLGAGGGDSLENVWPECQAPGAPPVAVGEREFKIKDRFAEHDVVRQIKAGADLADIQRRIAQDWTQFITESPK